jgi:outer membrane immunogenic protein
VQAGFNVQSGAFVWGLESDLGYLGLKGTGQWNPYPDFMDTSASFAATFRGRAGFTSGNALVYFTGGGILGDLNNRIRLNNGQWQTFATNAQWGWTAGAGVEWALDRQWSLKTEYLYYSFGKETVFTDNCGAGNCYFSTEAAGSLLRIGLNYRFGRP